MELKYQVAINENKHLYGPSYKKRVDQVYDNMELLDDNNQIGFTDKFQKPKWMSDGVGQGMRMDFDIAKARQKSGKRVLPKFNSRMKGIIFFEDDLDKELEKHKRTNSVVMAVPGLR